MNINSHALNLILFHTRTLHHKPTRCPPCKSFTPLLIDFYNESKDELEIIFLSSDRDEESFSTYFGKMPWLAMVPGYSGAEANERQRKLAEMFRIQVRKDSHMFVFLCWLFLVGDDDRIFLDLLCESKNMLKFPSLDSLYSLYFVFHSMLFCILFDNDIISTWLFSLYRASHHL